ncbi:MAG: glycoside hydrolase family 97 N-terminal domain-containing protein, partial [Bacteroidales bacterium]|nr:glycoside hydrolase family 97 N-terminal domain-containing protein [Bacteroidales bacterium]
MRRLIAFLGILALTVAVTIAQEYVLVSPGGKAKMVVKVDKATGVTATCFYLDKEMSALGPISMQTVDGKNFGTLPKVKKVDRRTVNGMITPAVQQKRKQIKDQYNEMEIIFKDPFSLVFRAYDDGVAYRIKTTVKGDMTVKSEQASFTFPADENLFIPTDKSMFTHSERAYQYMLLSKVGPDTLSSVPLMVDRQDGISVLVTEADLEDYPGLYLYGTNGNTLKVKFPPYVLKEKLVGDRNMKPIEVGDYIAKTKGTRSFP